MFVPQQPQLGNSHSNFWLFALVAVTFSCGTNDEPGRSWRVEKLPPSQSALMSVTALPTNEVLAVGGSPEIGIIATRSNQGWQLSPIGDQMLHWIHAGPQTVWTVGRKGRVYRRTFQSEDWTTRSIDTDADLWGVFALSEDEVWAVGGHTSMGSFAGAEIYRFDGNNWEKLELPPLDRPCPALFKVWARASDDVYFVGANGILLHFGQAGLSQMPTAFGEDLVSLWGDTNHVYAVGGRTRGVLVKITTATTEATFVPQVSGLNGIWIHQRRGFAVGHRGFVVDFQLDELSDYEITQPTHVLLHGISGTLDGTLIAVGGTIDLPMPWSPVAVMSETF